MNLEEYGGLWSTTLAPMQTPPCDDTGPYVTPIAAKPLEAYGAHAPHATAKAPQSSNATDSGLSGGMKKN